jgi:predicted Rossmann-fold nucleotide-binding protein
MVVGGTGTLGESVIGGVGTFGECSRRWCWNLRRIVVVGGAGNLRENIW